jgi:hypothetical protein
MQAKWSELTGAVRNARFWALYRQMPDSCRAGFIALAQGLARELEEQDHRDKDGEMPLPTDVERG